MRFENRSDAGRQLATAVHQRGYRDVVVLGLPRGGVPVAYEVAHELHAPLDVAVVRKLGVPVQPELAMGAIAEGGVCLVDEAMVRRARVSEGQLDDVIAREAHELDRRARRYRQNRPAVELAGRTAIIVDDGIATGSTSRAACQAARARGATWIVLATPVAPARVATGMAPDADEVVCLQTPETFLAVGQFYDDFGQTSDEQVVRLLRQSAQADQPTRGVPCRDVTIPVDGAELPGWLCQPVGAVGVVVFVHGAGSSRHSPRNMFVGGVLNKARIGTLLYDLLTPDEASRRDNVFDIDLLTTRLEAVTAWLRKEASGTRIGYFGASTGGAAALRAAARPEADVAAIVVRGGRPDLAGAEALGQVRAPTLFIVGELDRMVLQLNQTAARNMRAAHRLTVVPGATHLFQEPGTLEVVARRATDWFSGYLS